MTLLQPILFLPYLLQLDLHALGSRGGLVYSDIAATDSPVFHLVLVSFFILDLLLTDRHHPPGFHLGLGARLHSLNLGALRWTLEIMAQALTLARNIRRITRLDIGYARIGIIFYRLGILRDRVLRDVM